MYLEQIVVVLERTCVVILYVYEMEYLPVNLVDASTVFTVFVPSSQDRLPKHVSDRSRSSQHLQPALCWWKDESDTQIWTKPNELRFLNIWSLASILLECEIACCVLIMTTSGCRPTSKISSLTLVGRRLVPLACQT